MRYFVVSDIHGFAAELKQALRDAGFRKTNKEHILVVCGDLFDRGQDNLGVYDFIHSIPKSRRILIRGNHEKLFLDLLEKDYPEEHDFHNCTVDTFCEIAGSRWLDKLDHITMSQYFESSCHYSYGTYYDSVRITPEAQHCWNEIKDAVKNHPITRWLKNKEWKNYYEIDKYILVHSFIPLDAQDDLPAFYTRNRKFEYNKDWRNLSDLYFEDAAWGCPWRLYKDGYFNEEAKNGKVLVCGHWHTSDFYKYLSDDWSMSETSDIFCGDNIIAIDGGVKVEYLNGPYDYVFKHPQNVLIIENGKAYDAYGLKIGLPLTTYEPQQYEVIDDNSYGISPKYKDEDICFCAADCETPCARKSNPPTGICTVSDFSKACKMYVKKR